jgi:hypothetical protein
MRVSNDCVKFSVDFGVVGSVGLPASVRGTKVSRLAIGMEGIWCLDGCGDWYGGGGGESFMWKGVATV